MTNTPGQKWKNCTRCGNPLPLTGTWIHEKDTVLCSNCHAADRVRQTGKPEAFTTNKPDELEQELRRICRKHNVPEWYAAQLAYQIRNFGQQ